MKKLAIYGADPDTGNMGVSALFHSLISGILDYLPETDFIIFDNGLGKRQITHQLGEGRSVTLTHLGARAGYKYYLPENLATQWLASKMGKFGAILNPVIRELDTCHAVLDVSGGDSFSDIYGDKRFLSVVRPKLIALHRKIPLLLMPQTFGPYNQPKWEKLAKMAIDGAQMIWARDKNSFDKLRELSGETLDPAKHYCGIDLAFRLPLVNAQNKLTKPLENFLKKQESGTALIGINVSGLIYQSKDNARSQYGFRANYQVLVEKFIDYLLKNTKANIVLIPHVMSKQGNYESDFGASLEIERKIASTYSDRITISPNTLNQGEVKWLISKLDWFCGTRMHSTIASLSSGVPTSAIAYSDKTLGVFESCKQGSEVIDPRTLETDEALLNLIECFQRRDKQKLILKEALKDIKKQSEMQLQTIVKFIENL